MIPVPNPPFGDWPVQYFDALVGFYWYVRPAVLVSQSRVSHGSAEVIDRNNDIVDQVLARQAPEIMRAGGLFIFSDWRSVKTYDKAARAHQRERMQARPIGYARRTIIVIDPESRLLRMAIGAANLFSRIDVATNIALALSSAGLEAPEPEERFP